MSAVSEQAKALAHDLTVTDAARRRAELAGDLEMRNLYLQAVADRAAGTSREVRGAVMLLWVLERTRTAELLADAAAALQVALAYADGEVGGTDESVDALAGCREVLRKLTEATA